MDAAACGPPARRATGHELVPHTWPPDAAHLDVVVVTPDQAETHRFAGRIGEADEPAWVRYDRWTWMMQVEHARADAFVTPLAWPE